MIAASSLNAQGSEMRVAVTGANGFLGRNLQVEFQKRLINYKPILRSACDLLSSSAISAAFEDCDVVVHLAANVGGVKYLRDHAIAAFFDNYAMGLNVINACIGRGVKKLLLVGTPCSYPDDSPLPLLERNMLTGLPSGDTGTYGLAKSAVSLAANKLCLGRDIDVVTLIPSNLYGPFDHFNDTSSHVVPALLTKAMRTAPGAGFQVWGNGNATRDFVYVTDAARAIADAVTSDVAFHGAMMNIASGVETSISHLADTISKVMANGIFPVYEADQPTGYSRRVLSIEAAGELINYRPTVSLQAGLEATVHWLRETKIA